MADLGKPVRVVEVTPLELPVPQEVPEFDPVEAPADDPVEVPA